MNWMVLDAQGFAVAHCHEQWVADLLAEALGKGFEVRRHDPSTHTHKTWPTAAK